MTLLCDMLLFMRNRKTMISSSRVLENIWDPDSRAEDNTVRAYVSYLRRKLEAIGADIQIRNQSIVFCAFLCKIKYHSDNKI